MLALLIISAVILALCIGLIAGVCIYNHHSDCWYFEGEEWVILGSVVGAIALVCTIVSGSLYPQYISSYEKHIADIMSINRGDGVEGHFILGSGSVKDVQYYFYYYNTEKGVKLGKVESLNTYVVETDQYVPSLYEIKESNKIDSYYRVYVPVGTIITSYILN